jgi:deoxyribodipyrimidine photolyase-related protein
MPGYEKTNYFHHKRKLPAFYWTAKTKMNCMKHAIEQSIKYAYAHHIQRLMVTGNFALLAGIHPDEVDEWYLGIYIDAIQWVEITNTRGMSQYADGGLLATKPYISSSNYIRKMSNYCNSCFYNSSEKTGKKACPFNSLYWNFIDHHRNKLKSNLRMRMIYNLWDKQKPEQKSEILKQAEYYLEHLEEL